MALTPPFFALTAELLPPPATVVSLPSALFFRLLPTVEPRPAAVQPEPLTTGARSPVAMLSLPPATLAYTPAADE